MIPLRSPKPFASFTPEEYKDYVSSLYIEPERKVTADFTVSLSKKGVISVRIKREPKYLTSAEVGRIAQQLEKSLQETWMLLMKRKIEIRRE